MGKLNEKQREQQEDMMYQSLECLEAKRSAFEDGYEQGWYDRGVFNRMSYPTCRNCKHRQFGIYCSLLDMKTGHMQVCNSWELKQSTYFSLNKEVMKRVSMIIAGLIEEDV